MLFNSLRRPVGIFLLCLFCNFLWTPVALAATEDEGPLRVKNKFFSGPHFTLSGGEEKPVFGFSGSLKSEFETVVSVNEEALSNAKSASTMRIIGFWGGLTLVVIGGWKEGTKMGNEASNPGSTTDDSGGLGLILVGLGVGIVFTLISNGKLKSSVKAYNGSAEVQDEGESNVSMVIKSPPLSPGLNVQGETLVKAQLLSW